MSRPIYVVRGEGCWDEQVFIGCDPAILELEEDAGWLSHVGRPWWYSAWLTATGRAIQPGHYIVLREMDKREHP